MAMNHFELLSFDLHRRRLRSATFSIVHTHNSMTPLNVQQQVHDQTTSRIDGDRMILSMRQGKAELAFAKEDEFEDRYKFLCIGKDDLFTTAHLA